jgi:beta-glucosidase
VSGVVFGGHEITPLFSNNLLNEGVIISAMNFRALSRVNARVGNPPIWSSAPVVALALVLSFSPASLAQAPGESGKGRPAANALDSPDLEKKVNELLAKMTQEEKIGQLVQYSGGQATGPSSGRTDDRDMIRKGQVGSLFNVTGARETNTLQRIAVENSRLHIPLIFGLDVIHGFRTTFPIPLGLASTWDPEIVEQASRVAAQEASASGVRWTFSPMVDVARDARWGRISEGAGEDPYLGSAMARAYVRGYQGERFDSPDSIVACAKHYVGYGAAEGGRDYNTTEISEHTLRQFYLPPFHAAEEAGAGTFMSAFNSLNGIPASANPFTLRQILKTEWGFKGFVVSDWTSVSEVMAHGVAIDGATAARKSFLAGVDMDMVSNLYHRHLAQLVQSGQVPQADIDDAVRRILRVKFAMGLFDHPLTDESKEASAMLRPESIALAKTAGTRSLVLLRNEAVSGSPVLPLSANVSSIALIGPLGDDAGNMIGSWGGLGRREDAVSLLRALKQKFGSKVRYAKGGNFLDASDTDIAGAVKAAQESDVAILAMGEDAPNMTGEAAARASIGLPGRQQELLEKVVATGKPVVLILFSGRPLTLPWAFEHVPAVVAAWFPGVQAGNALTDVLFGDAAPTGHLPLSWPRSVGQEPLYYNALNTGRPEADPAHPGEPGEKKFLSRYIDEQNSPQFPFGYGLTYTSFTYGATQASAKPISFANLQRAFAAKGQLVTVLSVSADVKNTGSRAGEALPQLYIRLDGTSIAMPVRMLKGFQRLTLAPGESRKVTFDLDAETFAFWGAENKFGVEPARLTVWIAPNSAEGQGTTLDISGK